MSSGFTYKQDLPPAAGYAPIRYKRNLPKRGPAGWVGLGVVGLITVVAGKWKIDTRKEELELEREDQWSRIYLVPLLQAEADRDLQRQIEENRRRESKVMAEIPGWEVDKNVYNDKSYFWTLARRRTPIPPID